MTAVVKGVVLTALVQVLLAGIAYFVLLPYVKKLVCFWRCTLVAGVWIHVPGSLTRAFQGARLVA